MGLSLLYPLYHSFPRNVSGFWGYRSDPSHPGRTSPTRPTGASGRMASGRMEEWEKNQILGPAPPSWCPRKHEPHETLRLRPPRHCHRPRPRPSARRHPCGCPSDVPSWPHPRLQARPQVGCHPTRAPRPHCVTLRTAVAAEAYGRRSRIPNSLGRRVPSCATHGHATDVVSAGVTSLEKFTPAVILVGRTPRTRTTVDVVKTRDTSELCGAGSNPAPPTRRPHSTDSDPGVSSAVEQKSGASQYPLIDLLDHGLTRAVALCPP